MAPGSGSGRPSSTPKPALTPGFRPFSVLLLASLTYIVVFFTLFRTNELASVPSADEGGSWGSAELDEAWRDLAKITAHPHPYISHANTAVHNYILDALRDIQRIYGRDVVQISDEARKGFLRSGTWAIDRGNAPGYAVYFEGTNILVRINPPFPYSTGQDEKQDAILISAHYDSVSTAPGATDDGMGVVTALQLVKYFARIRSKSKGTTDEKDKDGLLKRPVIVLFNNGEEDWLNGAHSFLQHPWSNLTSTFLNLEGAGGGGRPLLFRSTSPSLLDALKTDKYAHPHANVFSADAFSRGVIASGTDYSVYSGPRLLNSNVSPKGGNDTASQGGMQGVDLAFYKGRNRYHTKLDAMAYTEGGKRSLWSMMESARAAADGFVFGDIVESKDKKNDDDEREEDTVEGAVWFDVFRKFFFLFSIDALVDFNIVFLIAGPILIIALAIFESRSSNSGSDPDSDSDDEDDRRRVNYGYGATHGHGNGSRAGRHERREKKPKFSTRLWIHTRFWFAFLGTVGVLALLGWFFALFNPFAIYGSPYLVLLVFALTSHLTLTGLLSVPSSFPLPKALKPKYTVPVLHQKRIIFRNLYLLTWVLLVVGTVGLRRGVGSGYVFSIWNVCVVGGVVLVGIETVLSGREGKGYMKLSDGNDTSDSDSDDEEEIRRFAGQVGGRHSAAPGRSEHAPLVVHAHPRSEDDDDEQQGKFSWMWILQFLVSVPIPLIMFGDAAVLFLDASAQTLADGSPAGSLYTMIVIISLFLSLPLTPFAPALSPGRTHAKGFALILGGVTLCAGLWILLRFPFTETGEIKVSFRQGLKVNGLVEGSVGTIALNGVDFELPPKARVEVESTVSLTGPALYLRKRIIPRIPSAAKAIRKAKRVGDAKVGVRCYDGSESNSNSSQGEKEGSLRKGLGSCFWATDDGSGGFHPGDISSDSDGTRAPGWGENEFIRAAISASPVSSSSFTGNRTVLFKVQGRNARACRIYIDSPHTSISSFSVSTASNPLPIPRKGREIQWGYDIPSGGVGEVRLWAKHWGEVFNVRTEVGRTLKTQSEDDTIRGRVACEWAEYQSGMIDVGNGVALNGPKIPAYEEILAYLPDWVLSTKLADGLVEVWQAFEV